MDAWIDAIAKTAGGQPEQRVDGYWLTAPAADPRALAELLLAGKARLSTVTAVARADGETDLIYHYVHPQGAVNLRLTTRGQHMASIAEVLPAANWIEREIHDLYAVQFDGHPDPRPLVRPPEMPEGFYRQPGGAAAKTERTD